MRWHDFALNIQSCSLARSHVMSWAANAEHVAARPRFADCVFNYYFLYIARIMSTVVSCCRASSTSSVVNSRVPLLSFLSSFHSLNVSGSISCLFSWSRSWRSRPPCVCQLQCRSQLFWSRYFFMLVDIQQGDEKATAELLWQIFLNFCVHTPSKTNPKHSIKYFTVCAQ